MCRHCWLGQHGDVSVIPLRRRERTPHPPYGSGDERGGTVATTENLTNWKHEPDAHDYPAAIDYLSLLVTPKVAKATVKVLQKSAIETRKAKDLLRASGLPLLGRDNVHVASDLDKVHTGVKLSPVLLVRGDVGGGWPLIVADGYHRICASYHVNENEDVPCRIVDLVRS